MTAYDAAAARYRPTDPEQLAAEIRRLRDDGLSVRDIAAALRLPMEGVINMLHAERPLHATG